MLQSIRTAAAASAPRLSARLPPGRAGTAAARRHASDSAAEVKEAATRKLNMTEQLEAREAERRRVTRSFARNDEWESGSSLTGSKMVIGMLTACTVLTTGYNVEMMRQRKESNALMKRRMSELETQQNAEMGIYKADNMPSAGEIAAQKARAAKVLAEMTAKQQAKDAEFEKRKATWRAKQVSGNKGSFQIKGDPDNLRRPAEEAAAVAAAPAPATA